MRAGGNLVEPEEFKEYGHAKADAPVARGQPPDQPEEQRALDDADVYGKAQQ